MSEYDKELQSNTEEYEDAMKPAQKSHDRQDREDAGREPRGDAEAETED
jgi:hypothetical protein